MARRQRLDRLLANSGYGTRKNVKQIIRNGRVTVDGNRVTDNGMQVDPESQVIEIDGERLNYREFIYLMMNKPQGVISATEDRYQETVLDLVPDEYSSFRLFPAGRLDKDTEGLMLLTNDGKLAHELLSPKKHVPKKYFARIRGCVDEKDCQAFSEGIVLDDGYKTMPARLNILNAGEISEVEVIIYEGKFHQVKRMFEATGKEVIYLKRLEIGPLKLDEDLEPGCLREITEEEIQKLKSFIL